jgi:hypothetical protein
MAFTKLSPRLRNVATIHVEAEQEVALRCAFVAARTQDSLHESTVVDATHKQCCDKRLRALFGFVASVRISLQGV